MPVHRLLAQPGLRTRIEPAVKLPSIVRGQRPLLQRLTRDGPIGSDFIANPPFAITEALFQDQDVPRFRAIERVARRKLLYLHQVKRLEDLKVPPGNRLEVLRGDRKGRYSIRINDQWRICFHWKDGDAFDVEIVDYH